MINGLDIYYSKNIGKGLRSVSKTASGLKPISKKTASGLKPISKKTASGLKPISKKTASGLKPISKGGTYKKYGRGLKILQ